MAESNDPQVESMATFNVYVHGQDETYEPPMESSSPLPYKIYVHSPCKADAQWYVEYERRRRWCVEAHDRLMRDPKLYMVYYGMQPEFNQ